MASFARKVGATVSDAKILLRDVQSNLCCHQRDPSDIDLLLRLRESPPTSEWPKLTPRIPRFNFGPEHAEWAVMLDRVDQVVDAEKEACQQEPPAAADGSRAASNDLLAAVKRDSVTSKEAVPRFKEAWWSTLGSAAKPNSKSPSTSAGTSVTRRSSRFLEDLEAAQRYLG